MKSIVSERRMLVGFLACACFGFAPSAFAGGTVYAMTNALGTNQIKVYHRASDGTLSLVQTVDTTGGGSGTQLDGTDSLGSEGGLALDNNHKYLFAVNTNSTAASTQDCKAGSVSSFSVAHDGTLTWVQTLASGGLFPNSLTVDADHDLLYVLNAGGGANSPCTNFTGPNITGFTVSKSGMMTALAGSTQPIDGGTKPFGFLNCDPGGFPAPAQCGKNPPAFPRSPGQIGFTPGGHQLVVTDKGPNKIYVFPVNKNGTPGTPTITKAAGPNQPTYFGFAFDDDGHLIVSEPFGATPAIPASPASAVSSFGIDHDGSLDTISSSVPNGEGTSCWVTISGRYAYVANNATSNVSLYKIGEDGKLTLLNATAATATKPNDMAVVGGDDDGSRFLYVIASGNGSIVVSRINADGSLTFVEEVSGLPIADGAQGLAAY